MKWYLKVVKDNYANFNGRARRKELWMFVLFNMLISLALQIVVGMISPEAMLVVVGLYSLAVIVPSIAVAVRRLHDVGKSGWWYFIALVPLIGSIWLLVLFVTDGNKGANEFGEDPKANENLAA
jgi:uncharacterized membrane protein YhaH (DUF805 family)